ncbi:hypothetical protein [Gracilinema caldarium]|uniref:hypothetical protein n=1 Tax=Gracilinema caldarium TaxID=215591 RepID=UPI0026EC2E2A|nr:hypothetical protein [Gracilinema caldarium]
MNWRHYTVLDREQRSAFSLRFFSSYDLFVSGMLCIFPLVFSPHLYFRAFLLFYFYLFAWIQGKRASLLIATLVSSSIVVFNLLVPYGKVLIKIGEFPLTQGAFLAGLEKAITLEGLIMLSKATIRSDLQLPGTFGALVAQSFKIFEELLAKKKNIDYRDPIGSIDRLLIELASDSPEKPEWAAPVRNKGERMIGRIILVLQTLIIWILLFISKYSK